jgi:hypothetical protein
MRPTTCWGIGLGLLLLCHLGTRPPSLGAEEPSPEHLVVEALCQVIPSRCPQGTTQTTADDLRALDGPMLQLAASTPPEDPLASACRYVGFQTEWLASKRDAGPGQAHLKREWVSLYGDRVLCNQNPFVPRGCTLWVCSQRHRFRTILPR